MCCDLRFSGRLELVVGSIERNQGFLIRLADCLELVDMASSVGKVNLDDLQGSPV